MTKRLVGISWNHTRGMVPLQASAQRYSELHEDVQIIWKTRSLQAFADAPINKLAQNYDLLVIDHPHAGFAASSNVIIPLDKYFEANFLNDQKQNSVGKSYESYIFDNQLWALPIDAAAPVSSYRKDLFEQRQLDLPGSWEEVIELAKEKLVVAPAVAINTLMDFYMFCLVFKDNKLFATEEEVVDKEVGLQALDQIAKITKYLPKWCQKADPIAIYNYLAISEQELYCPAAYGYSVYNMRGYGKNLVQSGGLVKFNGKQLCSTLGGTGLSISAHCENIELAVDYSKMVASSDFQKTIYVSSGGQPAYKQAWTYNYANGLVNNYFIDTLSSLEQAYLRPRYDGYIDFQDQASNVLFDFRWRGLASDLAIEKLNQAYQKTRK